MVKYVVVTGGVLSGIGKGVIASSTAMLMKAYGFRVTSIKIDPYLNIDAGTMSPFEHGEVFVLNDGGEADLDLGNYERFGNLTLGRDNNITTGKIYQRVIEKERKGEYLGHTVQVVPHIVNEIQDWIERVAAIPADGKEGSPDICVIELGGTVGDIESMPFVEALRQFQFRVGLDNFCVVHVSLVPVLGVVGEQKTKPTQNSVRTLRSLGLNPRLLCCRSSQPLDASVREKLSMFCQVTPSSVISVYDASNLYRVPLLLVQQQMPLQIMEHLRLESHTPSLESWIQLAEKVDRIKEKKVSAVKIAVVGKYTGLSDSYLSVIKGIEHAANYIGKHAKILWIDASDLEDESKEAYSSAWEVLKSANGILVPGGFGSRGTEGKILAAKYARENKVPYFGICLGFQIMVIEYAQTFTELTECTSEEFVNDGSTAKTHVIVNMPEISTTQLGGTMRLGARRTIFNLQADSLVKKLYQLIDPSVENYVDERHRHRYEVNPSYVEIISKAGLLFTGQDESGVRQEIAELPRDAHPFYIGVQFHPEFLSRPLRPSAPFVGLLMASSGILDSWLETGLSNFDEKDQDNLGQL